MDPSAWLVSNTAPSFVVTSIRTSLIMAAVEGFPKTVALTTEFVARTYLLTEPPPPDNVLAFESNTVVSVAVTISAFATDPHFSGSAFQGSPKKRALYCRKAIIRAGSRVFVDAKRAIRSV